MVATVDKISYVDFEVVNDIETRAVYSVILMMEHKDKRYNNLGALDVEDDPTFRECCGVFVLHDIEKNEFTVNPAIIYNDINANSKEFAKLEQIEVEEIHRWMVFNEAERREAPVLDRFTTEQFKAEHSEMFDL